MPSTGELGFAPVLHNITPEQVVFVYNTNQSGSLEVAQYYQTRRELPDGHLIGLNLPVPIQGSTGTDCESTILDEADYLYLIETPLINALEVLGTNFSSDGNKSIWVIILGYGIPIAYSDAGELIAIASRLHRLGHATNHKHANHTYDRRVFHFFDANDANELFITAVLDGPTVSAVKTLIDRAIDVDTQSFIVGDIVIDPYGRKTTVDDLEYQSDIVEFATQTVDFGLSAQLTVDIEDPYQEPTIARLSHDAFYWGWYNPTYAKDLFLNQNERRVFLYNADDKSASNIHYYNNGSPFDVNGSDLWCNLAINVNPGYASCAGSVADPGSDAYLRPLPFFKSLHQGATLGESFLFASQFVDWKTVLIGDPLMVVNFPANLPSAEDTSYTSLPNDEVILRQKYYIEESLAWAERQTRLLGEVMDRAVQSQVMSETMNILVPVSNWYNLLSEQSQTDLYFSIVSRWLRYIQQTTNMSIDQWLSSNEKYLVYGKLGLPGLLCNKII